MPLRPANSSVTDALRLLPLADREKDAEILTPRHRIIILERQSSGATTSLIARLHLQAVPGRLAQHLVRREVEVVGLVDPDLRRPGKSVGRALRLGGDGNVSWCLSRHRQSGHQEGCDGHDHRRPVPRCHPTSGWRTRTRPLRSRAVIGSLGTRPFGVTIKSLDLPNPPSLAIKRLARTGRR